MTSRDSYWNRVDQTAAFVITKYIGGRYASMASRRAGGETKQAAKVFLTMIPPAGGTYQRGVLYGTGTSTVQALNVRNFTNRY